MEERLIWSIIEDSIASGLRESEMSFRRNMKAFFFPGARKEDMYTTRNAGRIK